MKKRIYLLTILLITFFINNNIVTAYSCNRNHIIKDKIKNINELGEYIDSEFKLNSINNIPVFSYEKQDDFYVLEERFDIESFEPTLPDEYYNNINSMEDAKK